MASSTQKKTTSTRKPPEQRTSSSRQSGSRSSASRRSEPERKPIRREVGAVVCLLLGIFALLGLFHVEALFIDFFCNTVKGLLGKGFWLLPFALLGCAFILGFHRGRPVCLRVWCTLTLPVVFGSILHLLSAKGEYPFAGGLVKLLWEGGKALECGGLVSGFLAQLLIVVFSRIGAGLILLLATLLLLMGAFRVTPADVLRWFQDRPARPEYEPEPEPEPQPREKPARAATAVSPARRRNIDIPVDDGPLPEGVEPQAESAPEPAKRGFFNRRSKVPAPDQVLTGDQSAADGAASGSAGTEAPSVEQKAGGWRPETGTTAPEMGESAPEKTAKIQPPEPFPLPKEDFLKGVETPQTDPAVTKLKKGEAAQAAALVGEEAAQSLAQPAPIYQYPPISLLDVPGSTDAAGVAGELRANQTRLTDTIHSFGIDANIINVTRGPSVTRYELELDQGVRLNKLTNLADDIALALGASGVRIAPIPDKISMVGIEVPNKLVTPVSIHEVIDSREFRDHKSKVAFAVGKDIGGSPIVGNIAKLPHLLIAGTTGSGKSVCTNSLIISLLYKATPEEVRLIMVDPKMVELGIYNGIPHLLIPVVTDPKKAAGALQWAVVEMMKRYRAFSEVGVRDLASYNAHAAKTEDMETMPQIVVVIDELADLMLVAAKEVEESICRVAQMGRAAGMHLVIATQRPSADVITGLMKANIPSRIAFAVASSLESRIILDQTGAEKLVGRGDMLYFPLGSGKPTRVQGCLISDEEVARVVGFIKQNSGDAQYDESVLHDIEQNVANSEKGSKGVGGSAPEEVSNEYDELLPAAIEVVVETGMASVSMLQRRLKLGYSRAARLVDQMEEKGVVGPFEGSKPRQVLITKEQWQEMQYRQGMVDRAPDAPPVSEPVPEELDFERDAVPQPTDLPPFDMGEEDF